MLYHNPQNVTSPKDFVESVQVIHDGGPNSYSIAIVNWEGTSCLAMRWNVARREHDDNEKINNIKTCVGMPSSRGFPVWFIIPEDLIDKESDVFKKIEKAKSDFGV